MKSVFIFFSKSDFSIIVLDKANVKSKLSYHALLQFDHKIMPQTLPID